MRKRTIRNGMRLVFAALLLIILASFFHAGLADFFNLSIGTELHFYGTGIFLAAAMGGYGAVLIVLGFISSGNSRDAGVRLLPIFLLIAAVVSLFFYLLVSSFNEPVRPERLRPGETITI